MKDEAASAGRGVIFIGAAKIYFMIAGTAIELALSRLGATLYGGYGFVTSTVSTLNNVVVTGTIQAVSRATTADPTHPDVAKATGLKMHLFVGLPLAIIFGALAPLWAHLAHDSSKTGPLALSALIVLGYAFYAVLVGAANGARQFHKQAGLDMLFATLRAIGVIGAAVVAGSLGVYAPIGGWVGAVAVIFVVAALWVRLPRGAAAGDIRPMVTFLGGVATYLILVNLLMTADSLILKRLSAERFLDQGVDADIAAVIADGRIGYYRGVQLLARLPFQLMLAVTFVIFPLVSQATFEKDLEKTRAYVRTTMRYSLIFATLMAVPLAANPTEFLDVPFTSDYAIFGGPALFVLALGHISFAMFNIAGTILNGAGQTRAAIAVAGVTLAVLVAALWIAIPRYSGDPQDVLLACGAATAGAMTLGAIASGVLVHRRFGAFLPLATVVRVGVAAAAALTIGRVIPARRPLPTLAEGIAVAATFLIVLVVTRELAGADLRAVTRLGRGRK